VFDTVEECGPFFVAEAERMARMFRIADEDGHWSDVDFYAAADAGCGCFTPGHRTMTPTTIRMMMIRRIHAHQGMTLFAE